MTQEELDKIAAQTLHIDISQLQLSELVPVACDCHALNCHGWKLVQRSDLEYAMQDDESVSPDDLVLVECLKCQGDAYQIITRGRASNLPVEFALCTDCAFMGVVSDGVMLPITDELNSMLTSNHRVEYGHVCALRTVAKRTLLASRAQWN